MNIEKERGTLYPIAGVAGLGIAIITILIGPFTHKELLVAFAIGVAVFAAGIVSNRNTERRRSLWIQSPSGSIEQRKAYARRLLVQWRGIDGEDIDEAIDGLCDESIKRASPIEIANIAARELRPRDFMEDDQRRAGRPQK